MAADSKELIELTAEVEETRGIIDSAVALIEGLSQMIKDAGTDPAKLRAITTQLDGSSSKLANAVAANPLPGPAPE